MPRVLLAGLASTLCVFSQNPHHVLYLFDDVCLTQSNDFSRVRDEARQNIESQDTGVPIAIRTTSGTGQLDFTVDRQKLQQAVQRLQSHPPSIRGCADRRVWQDALNSAILTLRAIPGERSIVFVGPEGVQDPLPVAGDAPLARNTEAPDPEPPPETAPDAWFQTRSQAKLHWSVGMSEVRLDSFQRLRADVESRLDGVELRRRMGHGEMVLFTEIRDAANHVWRTHASIDLTKLDEMIDRQWVDVRVPAWYLPGDYQVRLAMYDTATREHAARATKVHVQALQSDPLPDAWRGMPTVEFIPPDGSPEAYYFPSVASRLHLAASARRLIQVDVMVNLDPSRWQSGTSEKLRDNLGVLLPELKALSQMDLGNTSINVTLLDLERRRVAFRQKDVHFLDWSGVREALKGDDSHKIDIKSMANSRSGGHFFADEIGRRVYGTPAPRAVIVLTGPIELPGENLHSIELTPAEDAAVFYIRNNGTMPVMGGADDYPTVQRRERIGIEELDRRRIGPRWRIPHEEPDQLEPTLKPLAPRLFDVYSPADFRKALAEILHTLSAM